MYREYKSAKPAKLLLLIESFISAGSQVLQLLDGRAGILDVLDEEAGNPRD